MAAASGSTPTGPGVPTSAAQLVAEARSVVEDVTAEDLRALQAGHPDLVLLDVREPEEHAAGHRPGAVLIPRGKLEFLPDPTSSYADSRLHPDRPVAVYCQKGPRALLAATLQRLGYRHVVNIAGGYEGWSALRSGEAAADEPAG